MKRLFWFTVGAGVAVYAVVKVRGYLAQASPEALTNRVAEGAAGIGDRARDFADRARAAMAERETELRDTLGLTD